MNATLQTGARSTSSSLSIPASGATTVELGDLELDLEPFAEIAAKLVKAGWEGNEDSIELAGTKSAPEYKYGDCRFSPDNFEKIRAVVLRQLGKIQTFSGPSTPSPYESALKRLQAHLVSLRNPFLARNISERLQNIKMKDWYNELTVQKVVLPTWPEETKERLTAYIEQFRNRGLTELVEPPKESVPKMKKDFQQVIEGLKTLVCEKIGEYDGWAEFQLLFAIPTFAVLNDTHFIKIGSYIDLKATEDLRDYIENLDKTKEIDLTEVKRHLAKEGAQVDLAIFLEQLIKEKPKRPGILTCWEQPSEFFVEKIFSLNRPNGKKLEGVIIKCEKRDNRVVFLLDDYLEVIIQKEPFEIQLISYRCYPHLIASIQSKLIQQGDTLTIRRPREAGDGAVILAGQYQLQELTGENEYTLISPDQQRKYRVRAGLDREIKVAEWNQPSQRYDDKRSFSQDAFERCHIAWKKICESVSEINQSNADRCVLIKLSPDEDGLRRRRLGQINQELEELYQKFQGAENESLMDALLDNLIANGMKRIDIDLLENKKPALASDIVSLSERYSELRMARTPGQILLKAVRDANYVNQVGKNGLWSQRTMQLLLESNEHLNHLANGDLVLFMGNAGSDKSTTIASLMKVGQDSRSNAQSVNDDLKIGEPIYTQGYRGPGQSYFLVDCPGFNDTRGIAFDLCANYSMDQVVQRSKSLLSLVIVLPVTEFFFNNGNSIIDLISLIQEKFRTIFKPKDLEASANVHLLLTNQKHSRGGIVADRLAEKKFEEFVEEMMRQTDANLKKEDPLDHYPKLTKFFLKERMDIWTAIQQIYKSGRVHFINLRNQKDPKEVLDSFSKNGIFDKKQFFPRMPLARMAPGFTHSSFEDSVGKAAHFWTDVILGKFLKSFPEELEKSIQRKRTLTVNATEVKALTVSWLIKFMELKVSLETLKICQNEIENRIREFNDEFGILTQKIPVLKETIARLEGAVGTVLTKEYHAEIKLLEKRLQDLRWRCGRESEDQEAKMREGNALIEKQQECESKIKNLENDQIKELLERIKKGLETEETIKKQLESFTQIDKRSEKEADAIEQNISNLLKSRRNLAIIIKNEWESVQFLRKLADEAIADGDFSSGNVDACRQFISLFDQHKDSLLLTIQEEYRF